MNICIKNGSLDEKYTHCLFLFVDQNNPDENFNLLNKLADGALATVLSRGDLGKKPGDYLVFPITPIANIQQLILISIDNKKYFCENMKVAIDTVAKVLKQLKATNITIDLNNLDDESSIVQYLSQTLITFSYRFAEFKNEQNDITKLEKVNLLYDKKYDINDAIAKGSAIGWGINKAKNFGDLPSNVCTPSYLATQAETLAQNNPCISTTIINEKQMKKLKMGAFLSVAKGSTEEGKLIIMEYKGKDNDTPYVLVGKGITFDSGGISLKGSEAMDEMKFDMCGAASVFGVMEALIRLKPKINVVGVVASAENMPSAYASKPGDIVTSMSGITVEILNTDAEGRLVLCDSLTYIDRFKPKIVLDIATLTGACIRALGHDISGMFSNNDELANDLIKIGDKVGDAVWRFPAGKLYDDQLKSNFADIANVGGSVAGAITAGCFLAKFTKKYVWAHLDIAGTAWVSGEKKGATGRPVSLLVNYLLAQN